MNLVGTGLNFEGNDRSYDDRIDMLKFLAGIMEMVSDCQMVMKFRGDSHA